MALNTAHANNGVLLHAGERYDNHRNLGNLNVTVKNQLGSQGD